MWDEVKVFHSPSTRMLVFPRIFVPWNMCTNSLTGGMLRRIMPYTKQSVLYCRTYFKGRLSKASKALNRPECTLGKQSKIGREIYK
jgi:hypothetical protein